MPANRSRTERWRDGLQQIMDRNGGLELSIAHNDADPVLSQSPDLVWRVRLLGLSEHEMLVESPAAAGKNVTFQEGIPLVGVMSIGQNRWMFRTRTMTRADGPSPFRTLHGVRIAMPTTVERCMRREFMRVSTAGLRLPTVECWPLLTPTSVVAAEAANRAQINELSHRGEVTKDTEVPDFALPDVGPKFNAQLMNMGGGGLGLIVDKGEASLADRARMIWMRVDLRPTIAAPLAITGKVAHTHIDSTQSLYAGVAFEFAYNPAHRDFVVEQVQKFLGRMQAPRAAA
ncbi:MAG TPA: hypothetical protein VHN77_15105 [Phycisphaerales bacterium]|nr:hypothetical protein [Phycisphaerales bacterium]